MLCEHRIKTASILFCYSWDPQLFTVLRIMTGGWDTPWNIRWWDILCVWSWVTDIFEQTDDLKIWRPWEMRANHMEHGFMIWYASLGSPSIPWKLDAEPLLEGSILHLGKKGAGTVFFRGGFGKGSCKQDMLEWLRRLMSSHPWAPFVTIHLQHSFHTISLNPLSSPSSKSAVQLNHELY